jgi:signal transduction histidine kinase
VLVIFVAGGVVALLRRQVLRPISRVASASGAVASGNLTVRVATRRLDELGALARAFNTMAASLERNQAELAERAQDLERSNRELEDYASVTAHDLQGPLVTIGMYAGLLSKRLEGDEESRALAEHIRAGAERMRALTRDLLAYARLERETTAADPVELDVVVRDTLEALAGPLRDRRAEVVAEELPAVCGDAARLRQVFQNLLTNAIKFTDGRPPHVSITGGEDADGMVRVSVRDDGIGFAPGQAELIFRPFQRLHSADRYEGTGIGLAVCQKIVEQHGGRIWAEGEPGEGATFSFTLPRLDVAEPEPPPGASLVGAGGLPT